ncbi:MAG: class I fructose-bisphosphate aldolase [Rickettsiales bacterium]|nr:class I fructose-bisphosphate aldolase [Rickettsiales bacterium]
MKITRKIKEILSFYENENAGVKTNMARILGSGRTGGTGKLVIYPVDQGLEHGPDASFAPNPAAYDPEYHYKLAIDSGCSAFASTFGFLSACSETFAGQIPTILKVNSANLINKSVPNQAVTGSVKDALRLGCSAIGFTVYPASSASYEMYEEIAEMSREAKSHGLAVVIWSYPRGEGLSKQGETALDICSYAAHIAANLGANIIKVKPPTAHIELEKNQKLLAGKDFSSLSKRIEHVVKACFNGRRVVVFSGGESKDTAGLLNEVRELRDGGANGSIIGRNTFQRPRDESITLLNDIMDIYLGKK